jgi:hypothetical protein
MASHFTFDDQEYAGLLQTLMQNLEAVKIPKGTILFAELEEIDLVYFFMSGSFDIGFEINKVPYYCIHYKNMPALGHTVGAYGCTFNQRSFF